MNRPFSFSQQRLPHESQHDTYRSVHISLLDPLAAQNITACPCRMGAVSDFVNLIADTHIELVSVLAGTEPDAYRRFDQIAAEKALVQREL